MEHKRLLTRFVTMLILLVSVATSSPAAVVYFDNSSTNWNPPYIYCWSGGTNNSWPGTTMTKVDNERNIWKFESDTNWENCIFSSNGNNQSNNLNFRDGIVYTKDGSTHKTYEEYIGNGQYEEKEYTIYFENTKKWSYIYAWVWDDRREVDICQNGWPGEKMTASTKYPGLYEYTFKYSASNPTLMCLFTASKDGPNTSDLMVVDGKYYTADGTAKNLADYNQEPDPFYVYYDNYLSKDWTSVTCQYYEKNAWSSSSMSVDSGSIYKLQIPGGSTKVKFSCGNDVTAEWDAIENMVYTHDASTGTLRANWTTPNIGGNDWPDEEYWIDPSGVNQTQATTLYFNRTKGDGALKNTEDIYVYTGVVTTKSNSDTDWKHVPDWASLGSNSKYKMTKVDGDIYSLSLSPSIAEWFGVDDGEIAKKLAFIFRDSNSNGIRQDKNSSEGNHYLSLSTPPTPPIDPSESNLGSFVSCTQDGNKYTIVGTRGTLELTVWAPQVIKVFTYKNNAAKKTERKSISVVDKDDELLCYTVPTVTSEITDTDPEKSSEGFLNLVTTDGDGMRGMSVTVDKASLLITFHDADGTRLLAEYTGIVNASNGGSTTASFQGNGGDEAFYGGGYSATLNWDGKTMQMTNTQTGGWPDNNSQNYHNICIPYFVSTNGYGILFDSHYKDDYIYPSASGTSYKSSSEDPVAYYFCGGGTMEKAMQNYNHLTGHQELPPYWALGYLTSKYSFSSDTEAKETVSSTIDKKIPIDGIVFDIHWQGGTNGGAYGMGYLDWGDGYPSKGGIVKDFLKDNKVHSIAITEPYFNSAGNAAANYNTLKNNGWLADERVSDNDNMSWIGGGASVGLIDVTNPNAMKWFGEKYVGHTVKGMSGWWLDLGEPEGYDHSNDTRHFSGNHNQVRNEFGNVWIEGVYRALKTSTEKVDNSVDTDLHVNEMRHLLLPRAGTAGMQRFSTFPWTGDIMRSFNGLKVQIPSLVGAAMSGVSYIGSDIGGFTAYNGANAYLYRRWVQLGVFYPMMRTHSQSYPEVWQKAYDGVRDDVRNAINMRYQYLPYTYTQSFFYTRDGSPIARPANYADKTKSTNRNVDDAYLWGPDVYVAPVVTEGESRSIKFPEGDWFDMDDYSKKYTGSVSSFPAPYSKLPHFQRRGSFVTRYAQDTFTNTADIATNDIIVDYIPEYGGEIHSGYFFDDDHTSVNTVTDRKYILTAFHGAAESGTTMTIGIDREGKGWDDMYETQNILIRIHDFDVKSPTSYTESLMPADFLLENYGQRTEKAPARESRSTTFTRYDSEEALKNSTATNAYYHDTDNKTMYVKLNNVKPTEGYLLQMGEDGGYTAIEQPYELAMMTFSYGDGWLSYSAPESTTDLRVDVFTTTGALVTSYTDLNADGYVRQIPVGLDSGIYIARLKGSDSSGRSRTLTVKLITRQ